MSRFQHLNQYDTRGQTAWVELPELGPNARIEIAPATEANKPFYNATLRLGNKRARRLAASKDISVEDFNKARREDAKLYPQHITVGWEGVLEEDKITEIPYSREVAEELFLELCDVAPHIFDRVRDKGVAALAFRQR